MFHYCPLCAKAHKGFEAVFTHTHEQLERMKNFVNMHLKDHFFNPQPLDEEAWLSKLSRTVPSISQPQVEIIYSQEQVRHAVQQILAYYAAKGTDLPNDLTVDDVMSSLESGALHYKLHPYVLREGHVFFDLVKVMRDGETNLFDNVMAERMPSSYGLPR
eukprot:1133717-Pelagomonas_calceolata.AAC.1